MKFKKNFFILFFLLFSVFVFTPLSVDAEVQQNPLTSLEKSTPSDIQEQGDVPTLAGNLIGVGLSLIGVVFFILVVYGGVLYMTSRGNEEQAARGRNTIIAASIGVILVLSSYALVSFVFSAIGVSQVGGGNSSNTTTNQASQNQCNGQCIDISNCLNVSGNTQTQLENSCDASNWCQRGLCPGNWRNVCCTQTK